MNIISVSKKQIEKNTKKRYRYRYRTGNSKKKKMSTIL